MRGRNIRRFGRSAQSSAAARRSFGWPAVAFDCLGRSCRMTQPHVGRFVAFARGRVRASGRGSRFRVRVLSQRHRRATISATPLFLNVTVPPMPKRKSPQPHSRSKAAAPSEKAWKTPRSRRPSARARSVSASMIRRHVVPRRAGVDRYGQVESCGQPQLGDEGLGLLGDEGVAPIVVQPDFADRRRTRDACGRVEQVTLHAGPAPRARRGCR